MMLRRVALVRTDVSEESITCIIRVTRIGEPGKMLAVTSNSSTLWWIKCIRLSTILKILTISVSSFSVL
jgi:hypothetical protein